MDAFLHRQRNQFDAVLRNRGWRTMAKTYRKWELGYCTFFDELCLLMLGFDRGQRVGDDCNHTSNDNLSPSYTGKNKVEIVRGEGTTESPNNITELLLF